MNAQTRRLQRMDSMSRVWLQFFSASGAVLAAAAVVILSSTLVHAQGPQVVQLEVDGVTLAQGELLGLSPQAEVRFVWGRPVGLANVQRTVVLRHGLTNDTTLWDWYQQVISGDLAGARKDVDLVVYDYAFGEIARYHLQSAWPSQIEIGTVQAEESQVVAETITLVCDDIQRVAPGQPETTGLK